MLGVSTNNQASSTKNTLLRALLSNVLYEYAEIKDVEEIVKAGVQPILELETERGIVRVFI
jgi:hypothetical protein